MPCSVACFLHVAEYLLFNYFQNLNPILNKTTKTRTAVHTISIIIYYETNICIKNYPC